ncbi:MAG: YraN family protein [Rickettsiales bacterium]|nr:YraN family protein [Rickettsiales bacterium]
MFLLFLRGYRIVAWRYKTKFGEIDVIAGKNKMLKIFEVKSSRDKLAMSDLVKYRQRKRIRGALGVFLTKNNKYVDYNISYAIFLYKNIFSHKFYE